MTPSLFDEVVRRSGLSDVFAADTIQRACERAGVDPKQLSRESLPSVVPHISKTLRIFLGPDEATKRTQLIEALLK